MPNTLQSRIKQLETGYDTLRTTTNRLMSERDALRARVEELEADRERLEVTSARYNELIFQVGNKYQDETRHETAIRYIRSAEQANNDVSQSGRAIAARAKETT